MKNFFTGYIKKWDVQDWDTARELDRQHNIGLLKGVFGGLCIGVITYFMLL